MASSPGFDPNLVEEDFGQIASITANCTPAAPLLNRASAGLFVPGSTFKVITASAALESKKYTPGLDLLRPRLLHRLRQAGQQLRHDAGRSGRSTSATRSRTRSNSVFCNIGLKLGAKTILDTAKRFGFYERPPLETPADERLAERALSQRASSTTRRSTPTSTPDAWRSARSACS